MLSGSRIIGKGKGMGGGGGTLGEMPWEGRVQNNSRPPANFQPHLLISEHLLKYLAICQTT